MSPPVRRILRKVGMKMIDEYRRAAEQVLKVSGKILESADVNSFSENDVQTVEALHGRAAELTALSDKSAGNLKPTGSVMAGLAGAGLGNDSLSNFCGKLERSFAALFPEAGRGMDGFKSFGEFISVALGGKHDPRLRQFTANEASGPQGGYTVPELWSGQLLDRIIATSIAMPRSNIVPMRSQTLHLPAFDDADRSGGSINGWSSEWLAEGATATNQTPTFRDAVLTAYKIALYSQATSEVIADGINFERNYTNRMIQTVAWNLDAVYINGNGTGKPLGILNAGNASLISVTRETAGAIGWADVTAMFARLHPQGLKTAVWLIAPSALPALLSLETESGNLVWAPGNLVENAPMLLLGLPLIVTEHVTDTVGLALVDFSRYMVGIRKEITFEASNAPGWMSDVMSFRVIARTDAQPEWAAAITPANGGDTLSSAVILGPAAE